MNRKRTNRFKRLHPIQKCLLLLAALAIFCAAGGIAYWAYGQNALPAGKIQTLSNPSTDGYTYTKKEQMDIYRGSLLLVNSDHPYRFSDPAQNLVSVFDEKNSAYKVKDKSVLLDSSVLPNLNRMLADFQKETGNGNVNIISGHRTYSYQENLLRERREEEGISADSWVAAPGASEHHTGQAIDFGIYDERGRSFTFKGDRVYGWITEHAWEYGFIMRYPDEKSELTDISYEPWHYRYVGVPHAAILTQKGFCYEEYIDYLRGFPFGMDHLLYTDNTGSYEIYYSGSLSVPLPDNADAQVSGNNADGFIVTVKRP